LIRWAPSYVPLRYRYGASAWPFRQSVFGGIPQEPKDRHRIDAVESLAIRLARAERAAVGKSFVHHSALNSMATPPLVCIDGHIQPPQQMLDLPSKPSSIMLQRTALFQKLPDCSAAPYIVDCLCFEPIHLTQCRESKRYILLRLVAEGRLGRRNGV
jgi:hypothetical protein